MASVDNYDPYEWKDAPGYKTTPTSATNFNHMETGIKKNNTAIKALCNETATKAENTQTFSQAGSRANINSGETIATVFGKIKKWFADLKTVAFSGSYNDLSNRPTIPTVNNGTLTIQKNGSNVATFSANQSGNATANISVPTNTNQLTNGAGYITSAGSCAYAIAAQKAVGSDGNGFFIGGCRIRNDSNVPRWNQGVDGTNEKSFVLCPNPHAITLTWNGTAVEVRVDGSYIGKIVTN